MTAAYDSNGIVDTSPGVPVSTGDINTPASNTNAVVTYNAVAGASHCISGLAWSYSGTPTGGNLIIQDGSNTVFSIDITAGGPGFIPFPKPKKGTTNTNLVVTLAAGGSGITGKVSVLNHWTE